MKLGNTKAPLSRLDATSWVRNGNGVGTINSGGSPSGQRPSRNISKPSAGRDQSPRAPKIKTKR